MAEGTVGVSGYTYYKGLSLGPAMRLIWRDDVGALIDFSTGWTGYSAKITAVNSTVLLATKTANITGSNGSLGYNVVIDWDTADHTALTAPGNYAVTLIATPAAGDAVAFPGVITFTLLPAPV